MTNKMQIPRSLRELVMTKQITCTSLTQNGCLACYDN